MRKMQIEAQFPYAYPFVIDKQNKFVVRSNVELISLKINTTDRLIDVGYPFGKGYVAHPGNSNRDYVGFLISSNDERDRRPIVVEYDVTVASQNLGGDDYNTMTIDLSRFITDQTKWKDFSGIVLIFTDTAEIVDI